MVVLVKENMEILYFTISGWFNNLDTLKLLKLFNFWSYWDIKNRFLNYIDTSIKEWENNKMARQDLIFLNYLNVK